jgi:hypothetical protein
MTIRTISFRDNADWYVYEEGYEYVYSEHNTDPFIIARNGEMRYIYTDPITGHKDTLRYTEDLINKGLHNDQDLEEAIENNTLELIDNPWFEVWSLDTDEESEVYHSLDTAEKVAIELHKERTNNV